MNLNAVGFLMKSSMRCIMKFVKIDSSSVDMKKYKLQNNVRRSIKSSSMNYANVAIMTDADHDG